MALAIATTLALAPTLQAQAGSAAVQAACTAPVWAEGNTYTAGTQVTYQGHTYRALQTHTAYPGAGWTPSTTPALWTDLGTCTGGGGPTTPPPTTPAGTPGVPGNLQVTATTNTSFSLAWNASTGTVTGYRVYEGTTVRATVTGTTATVSGLTAGSTHTYTVKAYNTVGESAASNSVTATTTGGTTTPSGFAAAPYLYQWGDPPNPQTIQSATGIRWFTLAFVLSGGGCTPPGTATAR
ncbi:carbohydrate-binding protein [Dactylosporangium cerinum]